MTPTRVLSLRRNGLNTFQGLRITNATAYGKVNDYTVGAQRRTRNGVVQLFLRLTAPDGRILDMVADCDRTASNAHGPVSTLLSRVVAYAFRTGPLTPAQADLCSERIEAVMSAGLHCLANNIEGHLALPHIQCAAEALDHDTYLRWAFHPKIKTGRTQADLLAPTHITWLIGAGFTPEVAAQWFKTPLGSMQMSTIADVKTRARFRDHGWTSEHVSILSTALGNRGIALPDAAWASVGPDRARLAHAAGMDAAETAKMIRQGRWDEQAIRVMGALNTIAA